MRDRGGEPNGPFWTDGDMLLRVHGLGQKSDRIVKIRRPFALVGHEQGCDLGIADQAVSDRHVYLHLDPRGVYVVDLVSRTGTRIEGTEQMVGWIRPGQAFEIADRRVELVRMRVGGQIVEPPPCSDDLLTDRGQTELIGVTLDPQRTADAPWVLGSELVFLGWSSSCGIQVKGATVARVHCAIARTPSAAYVIDLCGHHTWVEDRPVRGASILSEGELLTIGSTRFTVRIEPGQAPRAEPQTQTPSEIESQPEDLFTHLPALPRDIPVTELAPLLARVVGTEDNGEAIVLTSLDPMMADSTNSLLAWMMGAIQGGQGEVLRQQGEFQLAMTQLLRQIQRDNATLLNAHLGRIENIDRELTVLRSEIQRRSVDPALPAPTAPPPTRPAPPSVVTLKIKRTNHDRSHSPADSQASTTWLLERVGQLETENRSAWRDLIGRLSSLPKRTT